MIEEDEAEEADEDGDTQEEHPLGPEFDPKHGPIMHKAGFTRPGMGKYLEPCSRCRGLDTMCHGYPGMTCDPCYASKKKCDKSSGRGKGAGSAAASQATASQAADESKPKKPLRKYVYPT